MISPFLYSEFLIEQKNDEKIAKNDADEVNNNMTRPHYCDVYVTPIPDHGKPQESSFSVWIAIANICPQNRSEAQKKSKKENTKVGF